MHVTSAVPAPHETFAVTVRLNSQEADRLTDVDLAPAFYLSGTTSFPGPMNFNGSGYRKPIFIGIPPSTARAIGANTSGEATRWVRDMVSDYIRSLTSTSTASSAWKRVTKPTISLWEARGTGQLLTVQFEDDPETSITFHVKNRMDDAGPWVGYSTNEEWLLVDSFHEAGDHFWALTICEDRPRQWFE